MDPSGSKIYRFAEIPTVEDESILKELKTLLNDAISWEHAFPGVNKFRDLPNGDVKLYGTIVQ